MDRPCQPEQSTTTEQATPVAALHYTHILVI